ncbi:putative pyridoxal kinase Bud16p [[Candida] anglica]|uniref:pyridoxal kinase n=1 Tax=[Candida] anglica TaxID=148631 RepID=A0ABP0E7N6_9ASCO
MKTLLSIQSHVVHGYVGGKAAIFPLQCQGWDVDAINTVNFSNHTGYGCVKGSRLTRAELEDLFGGISDINITYDAVITGYVPNAELISVINQYVGSLKLKQPNLMYLLDPVMGDQGYLYVDKSCIVQYRESLASKIVDIITPNQFELELLYDGKISNLQDLKLAINYIHVTYGVKYVVVSSLTDLEGLDPDYIYCASSCVHSTDVQIFKIPIIKSYFTGVGDLFSALLLDKLSQNLQQKNEEDLALTRSVNQVLTIMSKTLKLTHSLAMKSLNKSLDSSLSQTTGKMNDRDSMKHFELQIIQSREFFNYNGEGDFSPTPIK